MPPKGNSQEIPLLRDINRLPATWATATLLRGDARERPLFTRAEVAELLDVPVLDVLKLAAAYNVGWVATGKNAAGPQFSARAVKQLLRATLATRESAADGTLARFDRAALVWYLLNGMPGRTAEPPRYRRRFEQELARVAKLAEPARSLRIAELQSAWKDAGVIARSLRQTML